MTTAYDWYDEIPATASPNVARIVEGTILDIGDNEQGINERTVTVDRLLNIAVGVDSEGMFAALHVADTDGGEWMLYSDGSICEYEADRAVGLHTLKTQPRTVTA